MFKKLMMMAGIGVLTANLYAGNQEVKYSDIQDNKDKVVQTRFIYRYNHMELMKSDPGFDMQILERKVDRLYKYLEKEDDVLLDSTELPFQYTHSISILKEKLGYNGKSDTDVKTELGLSQRSTLKEYTATMFKVYEKMIDNIES